MNSENQMDIFSSSIRSALKTVGVFSFITSGLLLVVPLFTLQVLDRVLSTRSIDTLIVLTIGATFVVLIISLLYLVRERIMARVAIKVDTDLGPALFRKTLQDNAFKGIPENRHLINDIRKLRYFLAGNSLFNLFDLPWTPLFVAMVFMFSPVLGGVVTLAVVVMLAIGLLNDYLTRPGIMKAESNHQEHLVQEDVFLRNAESI